MKKIKKILAILLIISFPFTQVVFAEDNFNDKPNKDLNSLKEMFIFTDIKNTDWFYNNVIEMVQKGIVLGYPDNTFKPQAKLKADEFIKMIVIGMGYSPNQSNSSYWADGYITKAEELKIVDKTIVKDYRLELTREQVARIVGNTLCITESRPSSSFAAHIKNAIYDYHLISDKYKQDVIDVYAWGILQGNDTGEVKPKDSITRAEATTVIFRMMDKTKRLPVKFDGVKSISGYNAVGELVTLVAPVLDKKPVNEMIDVAYILQNQIENSKGAEKFGVSNTMVNVLGFETLTKQEFSMQDSLTPSELNQALRNTDFTFNIEFTDFKGKYKPYELYLWKRQGPEIEDVKYQYQFDKYYEYFMEYYKEPFYEVFKLLFEDEVDTAWNYFVNALKNRDVACKDVEKIINERCFFINYNNNYINMVISLKEQYK